MTQVLFVILTVLKILGIVILSVLGLALLIVLIVLFWPIRYRLNADLREQSEDGEDDGGIASRADVILKVTWILHLVRVSIRYPADPDSGLVSVKIAFFTLFPRKKKNNEASDGNEQAEEVEASQVDDQKEKEEEPSAVNGQSYENGVSDAKDQADEENGASETDKPAEDEASDDNVPEAENESSTPVSEETMNEKKSIGERIDEFYEKLEAASKKPEIAAKKLYYTISGTYAKIKHVRATIESRCFERAKQLLLNEISRVIRSIMPRKTRIYVHYGADDPAKTADIMAYAGMLYPVFEERLTVEPDFDREVTGGYARIAGRIILIVPVFSFLKVWLNRDVRRVRRRFKELSEMKNKEV